MFSMQCPGVRCTWSALLLFRAQCTFTHWAVKSQSDCGVFLRTCDYRPINVLNNDVIKYLLWLAGAYVCVVKVVLWTCETSRMFHQAVCNLYTTQFFRRECEYACNCNKFQDRREQKLSESLNTFFIEQNVVRFNISVNTAKSLGSTNTHCFLCRLQLSYFAGN